MKKLIIGAMLMVSSLTFAHELTQEQQKQVYNYIKLQLDLERITIEEAQKMWVTQNVCCEE